ETRPLIRPFSSICSRRAVKRRTLGPLPSRGARKRPFIFWQRVSTIARRWAVPETPSQLDRSAVTTALPRFGASVAGAVAQPLRTVTSGGVASAGPAISGTSASLALGGVEPTNPFRLTTYAPAQSPA